MKGVIFDLGHTLMAFRGDWPAVERAGAEAMAAWLTEKKRVKLDVQALVETFLAERKVSEQEAAAAQREVTIGQTLARTLDKIGAPAEAQAHVATAVREYFGPEEAAWQAYSDAVDTLRTLYRRDLRLGILSNATDDALVQRLVNQLYLRPWIAPVFSSAALPWRKPRPEPFLLIAQRWGLAPEEVVVVGDTLATDILGAANAGMKSVLITRDESPGNDQHRHIRPDATVERLAELPATLEGLSRTRAGDEPAT